MMQCNRVIRKVPRSLYSTNITQDFITDLLARAKEATAKSKVESAGQKKNMRMKSKGKYQGKNQDAGQKNRANGPSVGRNGRSGSRTQTRTKQEFHPMTAHSRDSNQIMLKQPQFTKKHDNTLLGTKEGSDLMDIFDISTAKDQPISNQSKFNVSAGRRFKNQKNSGRKPTNRPGANRSKMPIRNARFTQRENIKQNYQVRSSEDFEIEDPTPSSLLKYSTNLFHTPRSRLFNFAMQSLRDSDYPVNREPNYRILNVPQTNNFKPNLDSFGKYISTTSSLILERQPLLDNTSINFDSDKFKETVSGRYFKIIEGKPEDFKTIANNEKIKDDLIKNSNTVKLSLQNSGLDNANKQLLYDVCSGLKPVSELTK